MSHFIGLALKQQKVNAFFSICNKIAQNYF